MVWGGDTRPSERAPEQGKVLTIQIGDASHTGIHQICKILWILGAKYFSLLIKGAAMEGQRTGMTLTSGWRWKYQCEVTVSNT